MTKKTEPGVLDRGTLLKEMWKASSGAFAALQPMLDCRVATDMRHSLWENLSNILSQARDLDKMNPNIDIGCFFRLTRYGDEWLVGRLEAFTAEMRAVVRVLAYGVPRKEGEEPKKPRFNYEDVKDLMEFHMSTLSDARVETVTTENLPTYVGVTWTGTLLEEMLKKE